jgi:hypothetical protein
MVGSVSRYGSRVGILLLAIVLVATGFLFRREVAIDRCPDRGGRWNYESAACEGTAE